MSDRELAWRIEETCLRAWPALREQRIGDWRVRFADGLSRRSNSANPCRARIADIAGGIDACAAQYRAAAQPTIFRVPSIVTPEVDAHLDRLGYGVEGETLTLQGTPPAARHDPDVTIASRADPEWLDTANALQDRPPRAAATYARLVAAIAIPAGFASLRRDGALVALAYAALYDGLLCFESVFTAPAQRGRGHARRVLESLLAWGVARGAERGCLQVEAGNAPAQALYRGLGMRNEIYRYHYRRAPAA
jgi:GNAT superfamily N-acetyltransferase